MGCGTGELAMTIKEHRITSVLLMLKRVDRAGLDVDRP
jgi:hypothetical protein